ncbi:DUF4340 domain-containing protein [Thiohalophilus sp.]|uniref:DUF4340 domain-containing protein n=1 Tax=Thiohalophilus sp. TaxID=3028392 RepID=UPI002ACD83EB|nr:DUF4340 domain-containing protein [Thiohalophilus sp.]MDZ7803719.1 DUF4340 domain-containing protein [Thiohalophilus sp.]
MRARLLLNLALLVTVIILVLLVSRTPDEPDTPTPRPLTDLAPDNVNQIRLQRRDQEPVTLYKEQGIWYMQQPYHLAANDYRVQALLRLLQAEYDSAHHLEEDRDPARYGLDQPGASLTYNDSLVIEFGDTEPLSRQRYVRIDDRLYLLADTHYYHTISPATGYLSHAPLPAGKIVALALPDLRLSLEAGQWQAQPPQPSHSADALTELIANWRTAQALRLEPYTQDRLPSADIEVQLEDRENPVRFTLQEKDGQHSLLRHDARMRYIINDESRQQLLQLPEPIPEPQPKTRN